MTVIFNYSSNPQIFYYVGHIHFAFILHSLLKAVLWAIISLLAYSSWDLWIQ